MSTVGGNYTLEINGSRVIKGTSASVMVSGNERTEVDVMSDDGIIRYTTTPRAGQIDFIAVNDSDQNMQALRDLVGASVLLTDAAGRRYSGANCTRIGTVPQVDVVAGTMPVVIKGLIKELP